MISHWWHQGERSPGTYDYLGNVLTTTERPDPLDPSQDRVTENVYDEKGRLAETIDALGYSTCYEYDSLGRVVRVTAPDGSETLSEYDSEGRLSASVDAVGPGGADEMPRLCGREDGIICL